MRFISSRNHFCLWRVGAPWRSSSPPAPVVHALFEGNSIELKNVFRLLAIWHAGAFFRGLFSCARFSLVHSSSFSFHFFRSRRAAADRCGLVRVVRGDLVAFARHICLPIDSGRHVCIASSRQPGACAVGQQDRSHRFACNTTIRRVCTFGARDRPLIIIYFIIIIIIIIVIIANSSSTCASVFGSGVFCRDAAPRVAKTRR